MVSFSDFFHGLNESYIEPVYHGGGWNGTGSALIRDGAMGTGIYFSNSKEVALWYTTKEGETEQGSKKLKKYLITARLNMKNPLIVNAENEYRASIQCLVMCGYTEKRAMNTVEKQFERLGNLGNVIRKAGIAKNHDGIVWNRPNSQTDYIVWYPNSIEVIDVKNLNS